MGGECKGGVAERKILIQGERKEKKMDEEGKGEEERWKRRKNIFITLITRKLPS